MNNLGRIIAIASGKGGVGKTTITSNLGIALSQKFNQRVVLVDCNITTSHLGLFFGIYYSPETLNKVLRGETNIKDALVEQFSSLRVLPASLSLSELEGADLINLKDVVYPLKDSNDLIFLDTAPGLGREAIASIKSSEEILFVTTPYLPAVIDVVKTMEVVKEFGIKPIGVVLNMVGRGKNEMTIKEVEQLTGLNVISSIPYDKNVVESITLKMPVLITRPKSKASKEIIKLAAFLIGREIKEESRFSRFFERFKLNFRKFRIV